MPLSIPANPKGDELRLASPDGKDEGFSIQQTPYYEWIPREALAAGIITPVEAEQWHTWITQAAEAGTFFSSVQMVRVAGRVPL